MSTTDPPIQSANAGSTRYLLIWIVLILLACIRYEYRTPQWEFYTPGLRVGFGVLVIIGIVLLFRVLKAARNACIERGLNVSRIPNWYYRLIPFAVLAVAFQWHSVGDPIVGMEGTQVDQWRFDWSDPHYAGPFLGTLLVVVLLLRIQAFLKAIEAHAKEGAAE